MKLITQPGIYDVAEEDYHSREICDSPSISSSGLRTIINDCPKTYWWNSCLNPDREPVKKKAFDFGKAAHAYVLEGEDTLLKRFMIIDNDLNLNSKAGREAKQEAEDTNVIILRAHELDTVRAMGEALAAHPFAEAVFDHAEIEKTLVWKDPEFDIWLRCRIDAMPVDLTYIPDYKTAASAKPEKFAKSVFDYGYHIQRNVYLEGVEKVTGYKPKEFVFIVQEKEPPFLVGAYVLDDNAIDWARIQLRKAKHTFADCLEKDIWPGYSDKIEEIALPGYGDFQLMKKDSEGKYLIKESA